MCKTFIAAILVDNRLHDAPKLQEILTKHGCIIKTRLGIHEAGESCSNQGLIILHMQATEDEIKAFENDVKQLEHVKLQYMNLEC
ncbi:hypothetical protein [Anaerocellum danielii]|uniref:Iron-only hydrogenase system regulator n=1 Tax=Anaerocellum danielii TaxID=1387557 RepID=A0ABZ0U013_9FIRM|nr:hypothetical protein [Caldicellulosiruptor danielii]WPX07769.1 hypothetical protein SOJ16_001598 [Caldicellulosiruptor danielii]